MTEKEIIKLIDDEIKEYRDLIKTDTDKIFRDLDLQSIAVLKKLKLEIAKQKIKENK